MTTVFENIKSGQRYLFYKKDMVDQKTKIIKFRANFIDIINTSLLVDKVECQEKREIHNCGLLTLPVDWVIKIETLDDITSEKLLLPSEIIVDIDSFL